MTIRPATATDLPFVAELHAQRISEGFLSSLGLPFLRRLYARVLGSPGSFILVNDDHLGTPSLVNGFVAGVEDLGALYRRFVLRDGIAAGIRCAPRLVAAMPRVIETLRYPSTTAALPDPEILAVAVAADAAGRGVGRALVGAATAEFTRRGITSAKVVTTADNAAALAMYRGCGFAASAPLEIHTGRISEVLVWTAS